MLPFKPTGKAPRSGYPELAYIKITHTLCGRKPTHCTEEKPKRLFVFPEKSKQKELIRQQNNVPRGQYSENFGVRFLEETRSRIRTSSGAQGLRDGQLACLSTLAAHDLASVSSTSACCYL